MNAHKTVEELEDLRNVYALSKITKTPVSRLAETQAKDNFESAFTQVMEPFRVESLSAFRLFKVFADMYMKCVFVDLLKTNSEALASFEKFVLIVRTPMKMRQKSQKSFALTNLRGTTQS